jgi:hypothetical protein
MDAARDEQANMLILVCSGCFDAAIAKAEGEQK